MVANIILLLAIAQQGPAKQATVWEVWAASVEARIKSDDKLKREIDVLRDYVKALEATQDRDRLTIPSPVTITGEVPAVPAKTSEGKAIAPADSVNEVLDGVYALQHAVNNVREGNVGATWHDYLTDAGVMSGFGSLLYLVVRLGGRLKRMEARVVTVVRSPVVVTGGIPSAPDADSLSSVPLPPVQ